MSTVATLSDFEKAGLLSLYAVLERLEGWEYSCEVARDVVLLHLEVANQGRRKPTTSRCERSAN